jgi:tetrahydromethanopterin S-methyltransferase subunit G
MLKKIEKKIDKINKQLEEANLSELVYFLGSKKEIFLRNILAGISKGVGIGIGITIITAILVYFLQKLVKLNIPGVGEYISDIVDIVERRK